MSQQHLNNIMLLNVHKDLTDGLDLPTITREFVDANECRGRFFGTLAQSTVKPTTATGVNTVLDLLDQNCLAIRLHVYYHAASSGLVASPNPIAAIPFARASGKGLL